MNEPLHNNTYHIAERGRILSKILNHALYPATEHIISTYHDVELLEEASFFCSFDLLDAARSEGLNLLKLGFFPWSEASQDFDRALSLILLSFYKNSIDSLRRAIELIAIGSLYAQENVDVPTARSWLMSTADTPRFKKTLDKLTKIYPYNICDSQCGFRDYLMSQYYKMSDYIHVKGIKKSHYFLTQGMKFYNGINTLEFSKDACELTLDLYIETAKSVALLCALSNPTLLIGFDIDRKFGLNPPISGLFEQHQADRISRLVPDNFKQFINHIRDTDETIKNIILWFENMPDITDDELKEQISNFNITKET